MLIPRIDLIKLDVEGFEFEVLLGARQAIRRHSPIVYLEFLPELTLHRGVSLDAFRDYFEVFGYSLKWIDHSGDEGRLFSEGMTNYLAAIPDGREVEFL